MSAEVEDQAGTIYAVDPDVAEPATPGAAAAVADAVMRNGRVVARPTDPPMRLWDRSSDPPERDTRTDRPYCGLRYHAGTRSFYVCAFSGIDLKPAPGRGYIAATQWHPEFHKQGSDTLDDTAILNDFLAACVQAREHPVRQAKPVGLRDRATRLLRGALQRDRKVAAR